MLELLSPHGVTDQLLELVIGGARAQRPAQVGLPQREQACAQAAVGGQPNSVAVAAERLRYGVDEADATVTVGEAVNPGGGVRLARHRLEPMDGLDRGTDLGSGQNLLGSPGAIAIQW